MNRLASSVALILLAGFALAQTDPLYESSGSWGQAYDDQWALKRINLPTREPGESIVVAVIDSGIDYYHPDLDPATIWRNEDEVHNGVDDDGNGYVDDLIGWNFLDDDNTPWDHSGHGTHTAGIIAAASGNGVGIAGVNPDARIMPLKTMNFYGRGQTLPTAAAIFYAVENGARVINLSVGSEGISEVERLAIDYAVDRGVVVVAAAGNFSIDVAGFGPAGIPGVVAVTSTGVDDQRPPYANFGVGIDIAAPGDDVLSLRARQTDFTWVDGPPDYTQGEFVVGEDLAYYRATGTSFSAPFVAGVASLILSRHPELDGQQVINMLRSSATDIGTPGWDQLSGYGLLDAAAALEADPDFYIDSKIIGAGLAEIDGGYVLQVAGTTDASDFDEAWIEIGAGENPGEWIRVVDRIDEPVVNGVVGQFGVDVLRSSSQWVLRLVTRHTDGTEWEARFLLNLG